MQKIQKLLEDLARSIFDSKEAWIRDISSKVLPEEVFMAIEDKSELRREEQKSAAMWIRQHVAIRETRLTDYGTKLEYLLDGQVVARAIFVIHLKEVRTVTNDGGFISAESQTTPGPDLA